MSAQQSTSVTVGAILLATFGGLFAGLLAGAVCLAIGLGVGALCMYLIISMGESVGWYFTVFLIVAIVANGLAFAVTGLAVAAVVARVVNRLAGAAEARAAAVFSSCVAVACLVAVAYWAVQAHGQQLPFLGPLALLLGLVAYLVAPVRAVQRLRELAPTAPHAEGGGFGLFLLGLLPLAIPAGVYFATSGLGEQRRLAGHAEPVTCVAISPDGTLGLTGAGNSVNVWKLQDGRFVVRFTDKARGSKVQSVVFSSDGRQVVAVFTSEADAQVVVFAPDDGKELRRFPVRSGKRMDFDGEELRLPVAGSAFVLAPNARTLLAGVMLCDVDTGQPLRPLQGLKEPPTCAAFSADGHWLVTGHADGSLQVWDVATGQAKQALTGHASKVTAVALAPDGSLVLSTGELKADHHVRVWDVARGKEVGRVERDIPGRAAEFRAPERFHALAVSADGKRALLGSETTLYVWDLVGGKEVVAFRTSGNARVTTACFSGDGLNALTGDGNHMTATYWRLPK